ncbi:MAG: 7-cyano-7-deazaguanine synthase QueC [Pseudomonadota bacterium]
MRHPSAVVLLSGGMDSTTCLAIATHEGYDCYAMSFAYGQKATAELNAAKLISKQFGVKAHNIVPMDFLKDLGGSALTSDQLSVPEYEASDDIPITYVPARNTMFLSMALGWAEMLRADHIFIGVSEIDYSGYPDCRPEYIAAFEKMANLATKRAVEGQPLKIHAPLLHLSKAQTILKGAALGVDYSISVSCYSANDRGEACGRCESCVLRQKGFREARMDDSTRYYQ